MQGPNQPYRPNDTIIGKLALQAAALNAPRIMNNQQPPTITNIPRPSSEIVSKSRSNSQTIIKGPPKVTFNKTQMSHPPSNILPNMPIHQSLYMQRPVSVPQPQNPNSIINNQNSAKYSTIGQMGPNEPRYRQLVSPQQIDYNMQMMKTRENINRPTKIISVPQQYPEKPAKLNSKLISESQQLQTQKSCWTPLLLALLCCLLLSVILGALLVLFNAFGWSDHDQGSIEVENQVNGTLVDTQHQPQPIPEPQANGTIVIPEQSQPHTSPGMYPKTSPGQYPKTSFMYPKKQIRKTGHPHKIIHSPHNIRVASPPVRTSYQSTIIDSIPTQQAISNKQTNQQTAFQYPPHQENGTESAIPVQSVILPQVQIQSEASSKNTAYQIPKNSVQSVPGQTSETVLQSKPFLPTQIPTFITKKQNSDFQYAPGSKLTQTQYSNSLDYIRWIQPLIHEKSLGKFHRLKFNFQKQK